MDRITPRMWLIAGFTLSLFAVVTNVLIVAAINDRVRATDNEIFKLEESIRTQTADIDRADLKYDLFRVLNHISKLSTGEEHQLAAQDSMSFVQDYLKGFYSAVNNVSETELLRSETAKIAAMVPIVDKIRESQRLRGQGNKAEADKLEQEADAMFAAYSPADELGRNVDKLNEWTNAPGIGDKRTIDIVGEMVPHFSGLVQQYLTNYDVNVATLAELRRKRADLAWWANLATYAAISLQLFGLMFVFAKDLAKDRSEPA